MVKEGTPEEVENAIFLTTKDVEEFYTIDDFNYAIHGPVEELYREEERPYLEQG
jgi:hypothetical protein